MSVLRSKYQVVNMPPGAPLQQIAPRLFAEYHITCPNTAKAGSKKKQYNENGPNQRPDSPALPLHFLRSFLAVSGLHTALLLTASALNTRPSWPVCPLLLLRSGVFRHFCTTLSTQVIRHIHHGFARGQSTSRKLVSTLNLHHIGHFLGQINIGLFECTLPYRDGIQP